MRIKPYLLFAQAISSFLTAFIQIRGYIGNSNGINGMVSVAFDDGLKSQFDYAFPLMNERKIKGTFFVTTDKIRDFSADPSFMSISELETLQTNGNEIGSHGKTHSSFISLSDDQIHEECRNSKEILQFHGFRADNFAYPYGDSNGHSNSIVSQYYRTIRSAYKRPYLLNLSSSQSELTGFAGENGNSSVLLRLQHIINLVAFTKSYAIVFFHNVIPDEPSDHITISTHDFSSFLDYGLSKNIRFLSVNQALNNANVVSSNKYVKSNLFLR